MKAQDTFIVHPKNEEQIEALKAFMNALKIKFETSKDKDYDPVFVEKVLEAEKEADAGEVKRIEREDLKDFLGL